MSRAVWKATLNVGDARVPMPKGAVILCAREQGESICVWYLCDPDQPLDGRRLVVVGTGHNHSDLAALDYIGSAHLQGGAFVFHVFAD